MVPAAHLVKVVCDQVPVSFLRYLDKAPEAPRLHLVIGVEHGHERRLRLPEPAVARRCRTKIVRLLEDSNPAIVCRYLPCRRKGRVCGRIVHNHHINCYAYLVQRAADGRL